MPNETLILYQILIFLMLSLIFENIWIFYAPWIFLLFWEYGNIANSKNGGIRYQAMQITDFHKLKTLKVAIANSIAEITFCRPRKLNSMNTLFWSELPSVLEALDREAAARVAIICANGEHFTAGMDLAIFEHMLSRFDGEPARRAEQLRLGILELQHVFNVIEKIRFPVIAAIQGACVGGGVDLVCATDIRFCTEDAFFVIKETELGITADVGTLQRLQHVMPSGLARELAYTSRPMKAAEALSCGFVNFVSKNHGQLMTHARNTAKDIAAHSPVAVHGTKLMLNYSRDHNVSDSLDYVATWQAGMLQAADMQEAFQAKKERRASKFEELYPHRSAIK